MLWTTLLLLSLMTNLHPAVVWAKSSCPPPPLLADAEPFNWTETFPEGCTIRYACRKNYVRKAGTSNVFVCIEEAGTLQWTNYPKFACISFPSSPAISKDPSFQNCSTTEPRGPSASKTATNTPTVSGQDENLQHSDYSFIRTGIYTMFVLILLEEL
ncbi:hypothetical protein GN956_G18233 [Arapaima gigas]